jgi:hypothetical protein
MRTHLAVVLLLIGSTVASGASVLYAGADTEEFNQASPPDRIAKMFISGGNVISSQVLATSFFVNGLTAIDGSLITGTVGTTATSAADAQTIRTVDQFGVQQSSINSLLPTQQFNEDFAWDGTDLWRAHFVSSTSGSIRRIDETTGAILDTYDLGFGVVGMTSVGGTLWITDWAGQSVGTWDPVNGYSLRFRTPASAGGLAYDPTGGLLWVGMSGGTVTPYTLAGVVAGDTIQPFGAGFFATVDGLAIIDEPFAIPEPTSLALVGLGVLGLACVAMRRRGRKTAA